MPGYELVGKEEQEALNAIFTESGGVLFAHGFDQIRNHIFRTRLFEDELASYFRSKKALVTNSGSVAQYILMKCLGVGPGDEVITQAFTFVATCEAILQCGATPVIVEVDESLNMDPQALKNAITSKTKCIVPVHMLGNPAKMKEINEIAGSIPVIEDACEALGGTYKGKHLGTLGKAGFFSLDFGKIITSGEGGIILTDDEDLWEQLAAYIDHGHARKPAKPRGLDDAIRDGFNFRMTEMQAAVGREQLKKLDFLLEKNRRHKGIMRKIINDECGDKVTFREIVDNGEICDTLMFYLPEKTETVVSQMAEVGIGFKNVPGAVKWHFAAHWPQLLSSSKYYSDKPLEAYWPKTKTLLSSCIALPINVKPTEQQIADTASTVAGIINKVL